ncbi:MAG TPA: lipopolysaccharide transport periplasmic protein LptA [Candidatus Eisenbacteria bacterium]|nr:lipopolysaccharide transport periplasmic protein LptA [Candidatus Eisenbacteria bacterium]
MRRVVALGALVMWSAATLSTAAWAQPAPARSRPARPAAAAPSPTAPGAGPEGRNAPVTVDADQLENLQKEGLVVFTGNVVASQNSSTQYADRMEVYLDDKGNRIVRTVSTGNVRIITKDCRTGTAKRAEYYDAEQRVVLIGNARVWRDDNVVTGEKITIFLAEDRSVVEGGRVKGVFFPKNQDEAARPKVPAGQCS